MLNTLCRSLSCNFTISGNPFNPFVPNARFLCTLKTSENSTVFWCFQWVEKGYIGNEYVNTNQENNITSGRKLKLSNTHEVMLYHLNVNSQWKKFESVADVIQGTFEIFLLPDTKIDQCFPDNQFYLNNFKIFRKVRNRFGGGIIFYVNNNLPWKTLIPKVDNETKTIIFELNVQSFKWLFLGCY